MHNESPTDTTPTAATPDPNTPAGSRLTPLQFAAVNAGVRWAASADPDHLRALFAQQQDVANTLGSPSVDRLNVAQYLATVCGAKPDPEAVAAFWQAAIGDGWQAKTRNVEWIVSWTAGVLTVAGIAHWNERRAAAA